jgi:hypothetical protein
MEIFKIQYYTIAYENTTPGTMFVWAKVANNITLAIALPN